MTTIPPGIDIPQLHDELVAAGVLINGLVVVDDQIYTTNAEGELVDLPPEADPVISAHDPNKGARTDTFETQEDAERLALVQERASVDPAFAALADLALRGKG
jgi:hypothetical protein